MYPVDPMNHGIDGDNPFDAIGEMMVSTIETAQKIRTMERVILSERIAKLEARVTELETEVALLRGED